MTWSQWHGHYAAHWARYTKEEKEWMIEYEGFEVPSDETPAEELFAF